VRKVDAETKDRGQESGGEAKVKKMPGIRERKIGFKTLEFGGKG
jgi:hypothetical protein